MDPGDTVGQDEAGDQGQVREDRGAELEATFAWVMEHDAEVMRRLADA